MEKNIQATQKHAVQYWFIDGLAELGGGVICVIMAAYFAVTALIPDSKWGNLILFVLVFGIAYGMRWLMLQIRTRTTYPHTGFVAPKRGWEDRRLLFITIGFTLVLLGTMLFMVLRLHGAVEWVTALGGFILAFIFGMSGFETKMIRFIYLAVFCLLLGLVLAFGGLGNFWGMTILSLATSLVLFAFGSMTRRVYLQQIQRTGEMSDER